MKVLVTGAATTLGQAVANELRQEHAVRLVDFVPVPTELEFLQGDLRDADFAKQAVQGVDGIVHLPLLSVLPPDETQQELEVLDFATRGTYNLMLAATAAGVGRVVLVSSLAVMAGYPDDFVVTEQWKPRPLPEPASLAAYLSELVCREFARSENITVVCLRLDETVLESERHGAVQAICQALVMEPRRRRQRYRWWVSHVRR